MLKRSRILIGCLTEIHQYNYVDCLAMHTGTTVLTTTFVGIEIHLELNLLIFNSIIIIISINIIRNSITV